MRRVTVRLRCSLGALRIITHLQMTKKKTNFFRMGGAVGAENE